MARVANLADAGTGEDWVVAKRFANGGQNGHRSTDNGASSTTQVAGVQPWLRLRRIGNTFYSLRSTDGENWSAIGSTIRNDLDGLPLQVGIWQATFSGNEGTAQFDDFSLRTLTSWNSISNGSWTVNGNWTNGVPAGAGDRLVFPGILQGDDVSVTLDGDQVAGSMIFATTNSASYSIDAGSGSGTLTINDNPGVDGISPFISVMSGTHSISVPLVLSNGVIQDVAWNSELILRGGISGGGGLVKSGVGTLTITGTNATYSGDTQVKEGALSCLALPEGIQASYMFDDLDNLGKDSSVNGNDLVTGLGSPAYSSSGKFGGALYLDGNSYLNKSTFPKGVPTGSTPYTIALWEKDDGSGTTGGFVGWGNNAANQCNNLRFSGNNQIINYWYANDWILSGLSPDPKDGNWHHIAVTWDGTTQKFYLDGSYVTQTARSGLNAQANSFTVGRTTYPGDVNFKGWLDNVQIANRALNAGEISTLAQSGGLENLLPVDTSLEVVEGAMVDLNGSSQTLAGLSGSGRVTSSSTAPVDLTVDSDSAQDFSGGIDGEIALVKVGSGSLTLSGVNAYNGGTTVSEGTLVMSMPLLQDVLSESKMWFDAADGDTITTNAAGLVTLWENKGTAGATLDAVPITAGAGFTVLDDELNGNPVLSLDGTNGMYTGANTDISGAQDRTLFVVGCRKNNGSMYFAHTGSGINGLAFGIASEYNLLFNYIWGDDIRFPLRDNNVYEIYDYMIANYQSSANLISGETTLSGSKGVSPNTFNTPLYLGSRFGGVGNGNIAEVIMFDRALTQGERAGIEAYLRAKWFTGGSEDVLSAGAVTVATGAVLDLDATSQTLTELSGFGHSFQRNAGGSEHDCSRRNQYNRHLVCLFTGNFFRYTAGGCYLCRHFRSAVGAGRSGPYGCQPADSRPGSIKLRKTLSYCQLHTGWLDRTVRFH